LLPKAALFSLTSFAFFLCFSFTNFIVEFKYMSICDPSLGLASCIRFLNNVGSSSWRSGYSLFFSSLGFGNFIEWSFMWSKIISGHAQHACGFWTGGLISSVLTLWASILCSKR